jgi:DNA-binding NarL/FixJ family response regulator
MSDQPGKLRIMVADDVMATRHSTCLMLRMLPNAEVVAVAENGHQAIEMARQHKPDIAVVDMYMGEMQGPEAIRIMRQLNPRLRCIAISSERQNEIVERAFQAGASDYLVKPFTVEELIGAIHKVTGALLQQRPRLGSTGQLRDQRDAHLQQLAADHVRARRTDADAVKVLEELAENLYCEERWLRALAMLYVIHKRWAELAKLATRLERLQPVVGEGA